MAAEVVVADVVHEAILRHRAQLENSLLSGLALQDPGIAGPAFDTRADHAAAGTDTVGQVLVDGRATGHGLCHRVHGG